MRKIQLVAIGIILLIVIGCTVASLFGLLITLGVDNLICSQVADISADVDGDGIVDVDRNGDGYIDESDQESHNRNVRLFSICQGIIGFFFQTAAGTIEVHNVDSGQWVILTSTPEQFNLFELQGKQKSMVYKDIAPGRYDKLRIDLEKVEIVTPSKRYNAIMPSKELIFDIDMVVERNKKSVVELKIDLAKSLHLTEDEEIIFTPVIEVKSKKNAQVQILDQTKKLVKTLGSTIVENKKFGMDLDGSLKENFWLDKNKKLSLRNGKTMVKEAEKPALKQATITVESTQEREQNEEETEEEESVQTIQQNNEIEETPSEELQENTPEQIDEQSNEISEAITLSAKRWLFLPNRITVNKGDTVRLRIIPDGGLTFTFSIPSFNQQQYIAGNTNLNFIADRAGTFEFKCSSCETWRGMTGILTVTDTEAPVEEESSTEQDTAVEIRLNDVTVDWRDTWGKITHIDYTIQNLGTQTINPSLISMKLEGYDDFEKMIGLSQSIEAGGSASSRIVVPHGFSYSEVSVGDLSNVEIRLRLQNANNQEMASFQAPFNLRGGMCDTLLEHESKTYNVRGINYVILVAEMVHQDYEGGIDSVIFNVNGEQIGLLVGETQSLRDSPTLELRSMLYRSYAGGVHSATFCLEHP